MHRTLSRLLTSFALVGFLAMIGAASGCGESSTSNAPMDEETKKVDQGVQNGMKEFMQSKQQGKGAAKK